MLPVQENREIQRATAITRWGRIKGNLGLNTTAKPLPEPAYGVRKAAGKEKEAERLAATTGCCGPSPAKKLKKEEDEDKPVAVEKEEAEKKEVKEVKNKKEEKEKPVVKAEGED
ncbi:hypothetical protein DL770_004197 [Monosporascus sp. CRB-9-2]|nr:hypothetical protein DL770_004197 [Monosporascus sp. CRB-9-2]